MPTATINGFHMNYELSGKEGAPHLLLCNSLASNLTMWDWQIDAFNAHFHVIRYDRRGHGKSGVPQGPYTIDDLRPGVPTGQFTTETPVWTQGMPNWLPAGQVPQLMGLFAPSGPPPFGS